MHSRDFMRKRKLGFIGTVTIILGILVKTLQCEIDYYFENHILGEEQYTKQAFSKSRANISSSAFVELYDTTVREVFEKSVIRTVNGRRFFAIDGTSLMLPRSEEIKAKFKPGSGAYYPHARVSFFYDVQSGYVLDVCFESIEVDERTMAFTHLERVKQHLRAGDIVLFDRGYPSNELIAYMNENNIGFIARLQKSYNTDIDTNVSRDFMHCFAYKGKKSLDRICKESKDGGDDTVLVTNVFDAEISSSDIYNYYTKRWGIEVGYLELKIRLEAEKFSGKTIESLRQDFFARVFLMNIEAAVKAEANDIISRKDEQSPCKYPRKTNENVLFGRIRSKIRKCLLTNDADERDAIVDKFIKDASKTMIDIRKGRTNPRAFRSHKRITEPPKRCL